MCALSHALRVLYQGILAREDDSSEPVPGDLERMLSEVMSDFEEGGSSDAADVDDGRILVPPGAHELELPSAVSAGVEVEMAIVSAGPALPDPRRRRFQLGPRRGAEHREPEEGPWGAGLLTFVKPQTGRTFGAWQGHRLPFSVTYTSNLNGALAPTRFW